MTTFTHPARRVARAAWALALLLVPPLAACSWSVPADPGENARLRGVVASADRPTLEPPGGASVGGYDAAAGALYAARCAQCHALVQPATFSAAEWPAYVERYGPRAGLFGTERARVLHWLQAHAR